MRKQPPTDMFQARREGRWGSREVEITDVDLLDREGAPAHVFQSGEPIDDPARVRAHQPVTTSSSASASSAPTASAATAPTPTSRVLTPASLHGDGEVRFVIDSLDLVEGTYKLDVAVHQRDGAPYDYHRLLYTFRVKSRLKDVGIFRPPHRWAFSGGIRMIGPREHAAFATSAATRRRGRSAPSVPARAAGRLVFTNGVFDLLHPGHVRYLQARAPARRRADRGA